MRKLMLPTVGSESWLRVGSVGHEATAAPVGWTTMFSKGESVTFRGTAARGGTDGRVFTRDVLCTSTSLALLTVCTFEQM